MEPENPERKRPRKRNSPQIHSDNFPQKRKRKPTSPINFYFIASGIIILVVGIIAGVLLAITLRPVAPPVPTLAVLAATNTFEPAWTPTSKASTGVTIEELEALFATATPDFSTLAAQPRRVIVNVDSLPLLVWPADKDYPAIEYAPRGTVHTILQEGLTRDDNNEYQPWWFGADGYGWIPETIDGVPTTVEYTPERLQEMISETHERQRADRGNPELHLQEGWIFYSQENYGSAISSLNIAINLLDDDDDASYYAYRGRVYLAAGDTQRALEDFNHAIELGLEEASVFNQRALVYRELEMYEEARQDLDRAIQLNAAYAVPYNKIGELINLRNPQDATQLEFYEQAIRKADPYPYPYRNRANYYRTAGDYGDHVINDYTTAFQLVPNELGILLDRARTFSLRGDVIFARTDFNLILERDPTYVNAYIGRATGYHSLGDIHAAIDDLLTAINIDPESEQAYYNLGTILLRDRQYEPALYCFNRVLEINPDLQAALFSRSQIYESMAGFNEQEIMAYPNVEALITPFP